ncbi:D-alanyl-D-alanine carboxypeptidase/D-alanyl-D-alanine-endopeptidase [Shimia sp.]|uniref:D-alanyl-D-alanine carboxypeptidase/D-alanyl-D-alanine endopeptidase n=1 Tax=Shimia sp. TaxID=1954381 RepID=UPI00329A78B9
MLSGAALPAWANPPAVSLRPVLRPASVPKLSAPDVGKLIQSEGLGGKVSFAVADAGTGSLLEGHNADTGQPPASVTKALTALYALEYLGPAHRFNTSVVATGTVENGVLKGDLVLRGGGDPTLDTNALAELARQLKAAGVREVKGRFSVWGGALPRIDRIDNLQPEPAGYNPSVSGLSLNYNRVHFEWKRGAKGYQISMDARSNKYRPEVSVARMKIANRNLPVYTYKQANGVDHWTVAKSALGQGGARWLPVRQPEIYAGQVFQTMARAHGIVLKTPVLQTSAPRGTIVATVKSAPLRDILKGMLKYSTNLTAEMVGMAASQARGANVTSLKASAAAMNAWAGEALGMQHAALVDHSGLGERSRMRADELVRVLGAAASHQGLKPILKEVLLRGRNGKIDKAHPLKVRAKTGTLHFVSGLAGYVTAQDGTELAFAIFVADTGARDRLIGPDRERPKGARTWNRKAKNLQQKLLERWGIVYGS